jgi:hypothetical protein
MTSTVSSRRSSDRANRSCGQGFGLSIVQSAAAVQGADIGCVPPCLIVLTVTESTCVQESGDGI